MRRDDNMLQSVNIAHFRALQEDRIATQEPPELTCDVKDDLKDVANTVGGGGNGGDVSGVASHPLNLSLLGKKREGDCSVSSVDGIENGKRMRTEESAEDFEQQNEDANNDHGRVSGEHEGDEKYSKQSILQHFHAFIQRKKDQCSPKQKKSGTVNDGPEEEASPKHNNERSPRAYERFTSFFGHNDNGMSAVQTSPLRGYGLDYNAMISQHLARTANQPNFLDIWSALANNAYARVKCGAEEITDNRGPSPPTAVNGNDFDAKSNSIGSLTSSPTPTNMIPERTMRQNNWAVKVWRDWAIERNSIANLKGKTGPYDVVPLDIKDATLEGMSYWLPRFITEVRRRDKRSYPPDTLMQIASGLQRHLRHVSGRSEITFFDKYSPTFAEFREALKARSEAINIESSMSRKGGDNDMQMNGVGGAAESWPNALFNLNTAKGLFRAIFYYNCIAFHITSMEEHHALTVSQFRTGYDEKSGQEYLEFTRESGEQPVRKYATPYDSRCIVKIFKKYFQHIPSTGLLYKRPLQSAEGSELRFSFNPVGINKLRETFKMLFGGRRTGGHIPGLDTDEERDALRRHSSEEYHQRKAERSPGSDASSAVSFSDEKKRQEIDARHHQQAFDHETQNHNSPNTPDGTPTLTLDTARPKILVENHSINATLHDEDDCLTLKVPTYVKTVIVHQGNKRFKMDLTPMT